MKSQSAHTKIEVILPVWADSASHLITSPLSFLLINTVLIWFETTNLTFKEKKIQLNFPGFLAVKILGLIWTIRYK